MTVGIIENCKAAGTTCREATGKRTEPNVLNRLRGAFKGDSLKKGMLGWQPRVRRIIGAGAIN